MQQRTRYTKNSVHWHRTCTGRRSIKGGIKKGSEMPAPRGVHTNYSLSNSMCGQSLSISSAPDTPAVAPATPGIRISSNSTLDAARTSAIRYAANDSAHGRWVIPVTTHCLSGQCTAGQLSEGQSCQVCLRCRAGWQQQACSCGSPKQLRDVEAANGRLDAGGSRRRTQAHDGVPARQRGGQCARAARGQVCARCIDCHLHNGPPRVMRASTTAASCA